MKIFQWISALFFCMMFFMVLVYFLFKIMLRDAFQSIEIVLVLVGVMAGLFSYYRFRSILGVGKNRPRGQ
jgi:hypothetical protein